VKLPGFLTRKKSDDEDDLEEFDDDEPKTRVIEDDDDPDLSAVGQSGPSGQIADSEGGDMEDGDAEDAGVSDELSGDDVDIDDDDDIIDFDDDFDDEDDDEDDDEEESGPPILFIVLGAVVLLGGVIGGATFWLLSRDDQAVAESSAPTKSVEMPMPKKAEKQPVQALAMKNPAPEGQQTSASPKPAAAMSALGAGGLNTAAGGAVGPRQGLIIPSVTSVSYQAIADQKSVVPLARAPDKALVEQVAGLKGRLPIVSRDGRKPWEVYSRPLTANGSNAKVAIVVKGLGLSRAATIAAIKKLPGDVSLAFSPYARDLNDWLLRARLAGHEVFLELPMESKAFPAEDAGPLALNTNLQVAANIQRLREIMSHMEGYVGLISVMGSKYMDAEGQLKPVLEEINKRGLMFVDGSARRTAAPKIASEIGLVKAFVNIVLDDPPERQSLDRKLKSVESILKLQPVAVAVIHAYPSSIQRLNVWMKTMADRKMSLVPLSAVADKQFVE